MRASVRLALYGAVLAAIFAIAGFTAQAVVPEEVVQNWSDPAHHEDDAEQSHPAESSAPGANTPASSTSDSSSSGKGYRA